MAQQRLTDRVVIPVLENVTAANGAPSGASAGVDLKNFNADDGTLVFKVTASSGTRTLSAIVWLYYDGGQDNVDMGGLWAPAGTSTTPANRGHINQETDVTGAADFNHAERIVGLRDAERLYIQIDADPDGGGSGGRVDAWLKRKGGQR